jgi:hypothetical protein
MTICNAGKVDLDAYLVQSGSVSTKHVVPAECALLAEADGFMAPGTIGFGFGDAKGQQWSGARRTDTVPILNTIVDGAVGIGVILERANQPLTVKHGAVNVTIPGLLAFRPPKAVCYSTPGTPSGLEQRLPIGASQEAVRQSRALDRANNSSGGGGGTKCDSYNYKLAVTPYPETHEVSLDIPCELCEAKAGMTPEQRAEYERLTAASEKQLKTVANMMSLGGVLGNSMNNMIDQKSNEIRTDEARRAEIAKGPYQMNWKDLPSFVTSAFGARGRPPLILNRHIILRATIARVAMPNPGYKTINVYFKEASTMEKPVPGLPGDYYILEFLGTERAFNMCTVDESIFREVFGPNFSTAMVGKTVELEGELERGGCEAASSVEIWLARQLKIVTPAMAMAKGQNWMPTVKPIAPSAPVAVAPAAPVPDVTAGRAAAVRRNAGGATTPSPAPTPAPAPTPPTAVTTARAAAPAPAPAAQAPTVPAAPAQPDPLINNVIALLNAKMSEAQILQMLKNRNRPVILIGADRARLEDAGASEKLIDAMIDPSSIGTVAPTSRQGTAAAQERYATCQAQANRNYPNDSVQRARAFASCMQAK